LVRKPKGKELLGISKHIRIKGKTPLSRARHRWEDNVNIYLKGVG
jgi:hypothetical protein